MVKILEVKNLYLDKPLWSFRESFGKFHVLFKSVSNEQEFYYTELLCLDTEHLIETSYQFNKAVHFIGEGNPSNVMFHGSIEQHLEGNMFNVSRLNLERFEDELVFSIKFEGNIKNIWNLRIRISPIDGRYCLVFLSEDDLVFNKDCYSRVILVDSVEKKGYFIQQQDFPYLNVLLNIAVCKVGNQAKNIIFNSGRIQRFEKKSYWEEYYNSNGSYKVETLENLLILNKSEFIDCIKNKKNLSPIIFKDYDISRSVEVIGMVGDRFWFFEEDYKGDKTEIYAIDLETGSSTLKYKANEHYYSIEVFGGLLYGVREELKNKIYYSFETNAIHEFSYNEMVVYLDEAVRITARMYLDESIPRTASMHGLEMYNIEVVKDGLTENAYINKTFFYYFEENILLVY
ncbi:hypothetical protein SAMN04487970_10862 [Paenibacillus tianmuensis]|uniref:Uncharacterized protein n=1 Tax=Paenibacillus tianmuensis TaxID=624147 RepID=A0A1G4U0C0_9BACL|nr:hypothetical protein [Paenibacillus tianmuensis]SCW87123.1 hypothetical protein SAMN04487970_10862 [Paenibacillus tianmuensis]